MLKFPEGYVAFIEELPGANTQGATLNEARENLHEAVALVLAGVYWEVTIETGNLLS